MGINPKLHSLGTSSFITTRDGRELHYMSKGTGNLTVVFESGMGASRSSWGLVAPSVAEHCRTVVYDRSGLGRSDVDSENRNLRRLADDLEDLLSALGPGPYILVGHSWGGPVARTAAAADLSRIKGLVLVDPSDEHCGLYFSRLTKINFALNSLLLPFLARTGLLRRMGSASGGALPKDVKQDHLFEDFTVRAARTAAAESKAFLDDLSSLQVAPPRLGNAEVSVISGTKAGKGERKIRPAIVEAHHRTVGKLPNARWVEAAQSGHMVIYTEPQLIVDEILRMGNVAALGAE